MARVIIRRAVVDTVVAEVGAGAHGSASMVAAAAPRARGPPQGGRGRRQVVEVMLSFDTTGSMYKYLDSVRRELEHTVEVLLEESKKSNALLRVGVLAHGDYCDKRTSYVVKFLPLLDLTPANVGKLRAFIKGVGSTGGGDADECYELALNKVRKHAGWSRGSSRALVLIGDANPHQPGYKYGSYTNTIDWSAELARLAKLRVKVYAVHAGGSTSSKAFYKRLADDTHGAYLPLSDTSNVARLIIAASLRHVGAGALDRYAQRVRRAAGHAASSVTRELNSILAVIRTVKVSHTVCVVAGDAMAATTSIAGAVAAAAPTTAVVVAPAAIAGAAPTAAAALVDGKTRVCRFFNSPGGCRLSASECMRRNRAVHIKVCRFFNSPGGCRSGTKCPYTHVGISSKRAARAPTTPARGGAVAPRSSRKVCKHYNTPAGCKFGASCKFQHVHVAPAT